ncbi:MAG: anti-sigma factor [Chitinophagaceae bacterium]|nr:anti-sigma factor [Chitinophagaceae bacterium]
MNIQKYISSGIVESYVLGLASDEERREFEKACEQYSEVLQARIAFETVLEKQAMENAIAPPADLKAKIFDQISEPGRVIPMQTVPVRKISWLKYAVAACVILLAGSLYMNITLSNENRKLKGNYDLTLAELDEVKKDIRILQENPNVKMASMKGMEVSPASYATVYWDTASHDVYLLANNLPVPASDKQYQLWALLDGQPIDLGMLDYNLKQKKLLVRMKNARNAHAFAITLEKKDRPNPSVPGGDMYVMGGL